MRKRRRTRRCSWLLRSMSGVLPRSLWDRKLILRSGAFCSLRLCYVVSRARCVGENQLNIVGRHEDCLSCRRELIERTRCRHRKLRSRCIGGSDNTGCPKAMILVVAMEGAAQDSTLGRMKRQRLLRVSSEALETVRLLPLRVGNPPLTQACSAA